MKDEHPIPISEIDPLATRLAAVVGGADSTALAVGLHDIWEECANVRLTIERLATATDDDILDRLADLEIELRHIIWHINHSARLRESLDLVDQ